MRFAVVVCLFLVIITGTLGIVSAQDVPSYKDKYVNDFAGVLNSNQTDELRSLFSSVDTETSAEVVFVSLDTINGEDISQYAFTIGDSWKVGKADKDNGLVILYVKDNPSNKRLYVLTGYGLEGILPDSKVGRLLDENYVPVRGTENFSNGIILFSNAITQVIYDNKAEVLSGQAGGTSQSGGDSFPAYFIWIILLIVWEIMYATLAPSKSWWLGGALGGGFGAIIGFFFLSSIVSAVILALIGVGFGLLFDYIVSKRYVPGKNEKKNSSWWLFPLFLPSGSGSGGGGGGFGGGGFGGGGAGR